MRSADTIVLFVYLALVLIIGFFAGRRRRAEKDYFTAGRGMRWFVIGISIAATAFSAINFTAFSGEVFSNGLYVALCLPVFAFVSWPITRFVIPFYHRLQLRSVYEYLEKRFDARVRLLASALFIVWQVCWLATLLYVPGRVLAIITGWDMRIIICLLGGLASVYTVCWGMKAVMITQIMHFFVFAAGIVLGVAVAACHLPDGFSGLFRTAVSGGLTRPFYPFDWSILSLDPRIRITLWSAWIGTMTAFLARYGVDQVIVQRYFTAGSIRHAQQGFRFNYLVEIGTLSALALFGFAIYAYALNSGALDGGARRNPEYYFTYFVMHLPDGMTGLIVAGLMAAAMSSVDAGLNSCSTAFTVDFWNRGGGKNISPLWVGRFATLAFGIISILVALNVGRLGSIFEIANKIVNAFGSPLLAIFLLAMFSRRANSRGMIVGGLVGAAWSAFVSFTVHDLALHYYAVVNLAGTLVACYVFSLLENRFFAPPSAQQLAWIWRLRN